MSFIYSVSKKIFVFGGKWGGRQYVAKGRQFGIPPPTKMFLAASLSHAKYQLQIRFITQEIVDIFKFLINETHPPLP